MLPGFNATSQLASVFSRARVFLQSGAGAVFRTQAAKMRERITPADFGNTTTGANATGKVYEIPNATYGGIDYGHGLFRDLQTTPVRSALEHREVTNSVVTAAVPYPIRYAFYNRTANQVGGQETLSAQLGRYSSITGGGAVWGHWDVVTSPLPVGSGLTGAPTLAQSFSAVIGEANPQNRNADFGSWTPERRITTNWVGGLQMVPETQDFSGLLGTTRIGYSIHFGFAVTQSPYTSNFGGVYKHAKMYNGYLVEANAIEQGGVAFMATGHKNYASAVSAINAAGSGYAVGNILTLNDGLSTSLNWSAQIKVTAVNGSGGITGAEVYFAGQYFTNPTFPCAVTGGGGSAATFTLTMQAAGAGISPRAAVGISGSWLYGIDFCLDPASRYASFSNSPIRLPNATSLVARNAADSADQALVGIDSGDRVTLGAGAAETRFGGATNLANGSLGFAGGTGGTVTQATSKSTGVTLDKNCGQITMNNAALAAGGKVSFLVANSKVAATDIPLPCVVSGGTANAYRADCTAVGAGSFTITVENMTAGSLSESPVIGFGLLKAANA